MYVCQSFVLRTEYVLTHAFNTGAAFKDPLVILYGWLFHGFAFPLYSLSLFLPSIIQQLGYASWKAQLMTVPCYAAAFGGIMLFAWLSARSKKRGLWIAIGGGVAIIGYIVLLTTTRAADRCFATIPS